MKKSRIIPIFIFLFSSFLGYSQERGIIVTDDHSSRKITEDFLYEIELFPGEQFSGYIYHYTEAGDVAWGEFHENPEVDWLSVSPTSITAYGCEEPVPVKFTFTAPEKPGTYKTTVEDYEYSWPDNIITLRVTTLPDSNRTDSLIIVNGRESIYYRYQEHQYIGLTIDQSWYDDGYCGQNPYIFNPTRHISRALNPPDAEITFSPASFTLNLDESRMVTKTFRVDENTADFVYEVIYLEWKSYPVYIKWKFVSAEEYCLGWEHIPTLNFPSIASGATVFGDSVYLVGGLDPFTRQPTGRVEVLREDRWGVLPVSMDTPRYGLACGVLENKIYVFGGVDGNNRPLNSVEYFDGTRWQTDSDTMPTPLCFHSGVGYSNSYYIFGGKTGNDPGYNNSLWRYSPMKGWKVLHESLPFTSREGYSCLLVDKFIYIIGGTYSQEGTRDSIWYNDVFKYDIVADTFSILAPMNRPRADFACGLAGGFIYVAGGSSGDPDVSTSVEFYDLSSGKWFTCEDAPDLSIKSAASVSLNDHLFLLGGAVALPNGEPNYRTCYGSDLLSEVPPPPEPQLEVQAFPNPFRTEAVITFDLPYDSHVRLTLYDLRGRQIIKLADENLPAGEYDYFINGDLLTEGIYFGELRTDKDRITKKLVKVDE